jgi:hypothetical protein
MIDHNFDPYQQLVTAEHNINQLILAINHGSELFKDLSFQHVKLVEFAKQLQKQQQSLELELITLRLELDLVKTKQTHQ